MSTVCVITFDHPNGVYNSGDNLNGHVRLQTKKSKSIRAISIKIVGYGKVHWRESRGKQSVNFKSHEQYLNSINYVAGSVNRDSFDLAPGIYEYTFTCQLPIELPPTMNQNNGKIKYKVIVTIDRRLRFDNIFKKDFYVNHILDLNLQRSNKFPRKVVCKRRIAPFFGYCCYDVADIKAGLKIPYGGFVPGQEIPFQLIIYNDSNINLSGAKVKFLQCCTCESTEPYVKEKLNQAQINVIKFENNIPRQTNKEFKDVFQVPNLLPTIRTKHIRIDYKLKAKIQLFGYSNRKFYVEIPIIIGRIPINNSS